MQAALIIPAGWNESLENGDPKPLLLYLDGSDINTSDAVEGSVRQSLGDFQLKQRDQMIENLPEEVFELGKQLPVQIRKRFVSMMEMWSVNSESDLYNPKSRVIDYVVPGIIGLILQLLTVTLMACTIARERESGTLYQLMVTSLRRREIVIGKMLPYLVVSILLVVVIMLVSQLAFWCDLLSTPCSCCGLLAFPAMLSRTRLVNLGVFPHTNPSHTIFRFFSATSVLCSQARSRRWNNCPRRSVEYVSELFPLTHFCRAFRLVKITHAGPQFYAGDLVVLLAGALITFLGAAFLLKRIEQ